MRLDKVAFALSMLTAMLVTTGPARATCSYVCTTKLVDATCNPLAQAQPVPGDSVRVQMTCTEQCCGGGPPCTETPETVTPDELVLVPKPATGSFTAHSTCPSVFVFEGCLPDGDYTVGFLGTYFGTLSFQVTGDVCPSTTTDGGTDGSAGSGGAAGSAGGGGYAKAANENDDSGCAVASGTGEHGLWPVAIVLALGLARRRVRSGGARSACACFGHRHHSPRSVK